MGLIGDMASSAARTAGKAVGETVGSYATIAVLGAASAAATAIQTGMTKIEARRTEKLMSNDNGSHKLRIKQRPYTVRDQFTVFDEHDWPKYLVRGNLLSLKPELVIFDASGKRLGSIRQTLLSIRNPLALESKPIDFEIEIDGNKLGKLKSIPNSALAIEATSKATGVKDALTKRAYEFEFNGWKLMREPWKDRSVVYDDAWNEMAVIEDNIWSTEDHYVISFDEAEHELLYIAAVLAIDVHTDTKSRARKVAEAAGLARKHR